ncbi:hypothetical protein, partial [Candidatus Contendibacter odensensis]|uniref:hypothetical protein n=1 Tax=Candidatus Contendibacter odensensis TaxID=1400860 RepID=UPI0012B68505
MNIHSTFIRPLFIPYTLILLLFFPISGSASIIQYEGTGTISDVSIEGVPVDRSQDLLFSFAVDDSAIDISTDTGRGEYLTGFLEATVGGITFLSTGRGSVTTNDIRITDDQSWLLTTNVLTDSGLPGWFQIFFDGGPKKKGLDILPLDISEYSIRYFATAFGTGSERTNFYGVVSSTEKFAVPEPNTAILIFLGLAG